LDRVAAFGSGIVYAGLCATAAEILLGSGSSGSGTASKTTAGVFGWPGGTWLVGIVGAVLIGIGLYQGYRGISKNFLTDSKTEQRSARVRTGSTSMRSISHSSLNMPSLERPHEHRGVLPQLFVGAIPPSMRFIKRTCRYFDSSGCCRSVS
jgi:Domain of Unknown Function (DUF1206)